jgi:chitinase
VRTRHSRNYRYFSPAVATNASRAEFAGNILQLYYQYNLDGIDIDWEYPGLEGASGNIVDSLDAQNFLLFLRYLRAILPPPAIITAAVQTVPFADPDGSIMREIAAVLDWVLVMNYDVWQCEPFHFPTFSFRDS